MTLRNAAIGATALALLCCGESKSEEGALDKIVAVSEEIVPRGAKEIVGLPLWEGTSTTLTPCPGNVSVELAAQIEIQLWAPTDLEPKRIVRQTQGLQSVFAGLGIGFHAGDSLFAFTLPAVFTGAGTGKDIPLDRFISALKPQSRFEVQVLFVPTIVSATSTAGQGLTHLSGLTLSPFSAPSENSAELTRLLGRPLEKIPAPLIFLAIDELSNMPPELRYSLLAHEMGHALGLSHGGGRENLMEPSRHARCLSGLSQGQVDALRDTLGEFVR